LSGANAYRWEIEKRTKQLANAHDSLRKFSARSLRRPDLWLPNATTHQLSRARNRVPLLNDAMAVQFRSVVASVEDVSPGELASLPFLPAGEHSSDKPAAREKAARARAPARAATPGKKRGRPRLYKSEAERRAAQKEKLRERRRAKGARHEARP